MQPNEADRERGKKIAAARGAMSQYELAKKVDLHPQTISDLERGIARTSKDTRKRIAVVLGLDPADLLTAEETEGVAS